MARRNVSTNRLQYLIGGNQAYWQRRTSGAVPLSAGDIVALAELLQVDPGVFFAGAVDHLRARRDSNPQPSDLDSNVIGVDFGADFDWPDATATGVPAQVYAFPGMRS